MIPLRNNHLYWFPLSVSCSWTMLVISHPLDSGSSCAVLCLPFYVPLVFSLFTVQANAYSPLTFALEVQFDWRIARRKSDDRLAVQRRPMSCSLPLHVVHGELSDSYARSNMAETRQVNVICSNTLPWALWICLFADNAIDFSLLHYN